MQCKFKSNSNFANQIFYWRPKIKKIQRKLEAEPQRLGKNIQLRKKFNFYFQGNYCDKLANMH